METISPQCIEFPQYQHTHQHQGHASRVSRRLGKPYIPRTSFVLTRAQVLSSPTIPTPGTPTQSFSTTQSRSTVTSSGATALPQPTALPRLTALRIPELSPGPLSAASFETARSAGTYSPVPQTPQTVIPPPFAPPSTPSPRKPSAAAPPSPAKLTPISQDLPVAISLSVSLTVTTLTPQARLLPSVIPQRPEPPPQRATSTGAALILSRTLTAGGIISSPPSATLTPSTNGLAPSSGLHTGGSQVGNRTSVPAPVPATTNSQAPSLEQQQAESAAVSVKDPALTQGKKKNWFQIYVWDYGKGK